MNTRLKKHKHAPKQLQDIVNDSCVVEEKDFFLRKKLLEENVKSVKKKLAPASTSKKYASWTKAAAFITQCGVGLFSQLSSRMNDIRSYAPAYMNIASAIPRAMFGNPELLVARYKGHINRHFPHVSSGSPLGFIHFEAKEAAIFTKAARQTEYGVATYYMGPFLTYYVTSPQLKDALVLESKVGFVTDSDRKIMDLFSNRNKVHSSFTDFLPVESQVYKDQRQFLFKNFHKNVSHQLFGILNGTNKFLLNYFETYGQRPINLRAFITALVLHDSAGMLGFDSETRLDKEYFSNITFHEVVNHVAQYGISENRNADFEDKIYKCFLSLLKKNYSKIYFSGNSDNNLIRAIFYSLKPGTPFPETFANFMKLDKKDKLDIAMSFASIGLGGMVHSTANTLDWAFARLLNDTNKLKQLTDLMAKHPNVDLSDAGIFDKAKGALFPIAEWVLHNVHQNPPFSHQVFLNRQGMQVKLPSGEMMTVTPMSLTVVNYLACNRSNKRMASLEEFSKSLRDEHTIANFVMSGKTASFGGSQVSKNNPVTRKCPAANTSLHEQAIIIASILRNYVLKPATNIALDADPKAFPVWARINTGNVTLQPRARVDKEQAVTKYTTLR